MTRKTDAERAVRPSVLDRLMDNDPAAGVDAPISWGQSVRQLKASLCRDLEWLLNSRRSLIEIPEAYEHLRASLLNYGLVDVTSLTRDDPQTRSRIIREVERAITTFEPRLAAVKVSLASDGNPDGPAGGPRRELRFVVEGLLRIDPQPEQVVFDTVLEVTSGDYQVRSSGGA